MSGIYAASDSKPLDGRAINQGRRLHAQEVFVGSTHAASSKSATNFTVQLGSELRDVILVELLEVQFRGVARTGSNPDVPYYLVELGGLGPDVVSSNNSGSGVHVLLAGDADTTHTVYSPPRAMRTLYSPAHMRRISVRVLKPDGTTASSGVDLSSTWLLLRVVSDLGARRMH